MSDKFTDNETFVCADWLNLVDDLVNFANGATTLEELRAALGVVEEAPQDGNAYVRRDGVWELAANAPELQILTLYLGASASPPTSGFNGQPLVVGMMYFDTTIGVGRVFTGSDWLNFTDTLSGVSVVTYSANRWPLNLLESPDGSRVAFTMRDQGGTSLNLQYATHVEVFVDGHMQQPDVDYTVAGATLTFTEAPLATSNLWGIWIDDDGEWTA
jgi:hypothetical protein